jgi:hypothetical protein
MTGLLLAIALLSTSERATIIDEPDPTAKMNHLEMISEHNMPWCEIHGLTRYTPTGELETVLSRIPRARLSTGRAEHKAPTGTCDTDGECKDKIEELCKRDGHGGVKSDTVKIVVHADGSKTCSGDCKDNGAIAFVTCARPK